MRHLSLLLAFVILGLFNQSCVKEEPIIDNEDRVAPKLPPLETFVMPFAGFEKADTNELGGGSNARNLPTYQNWFHAATHVVVWNSILTVSMVVPVASFAEAFNHEPEFQGNGIWLWDYSYTVDGRTYHAELTAQFTSETEIEWNMDIEQEGGFSKVRWYTGTTRTDGRKGSWTLYHMPNNPQPLVSIEYEGDADDKNASIRYTNIIPDHRDNGDYIEFRRHDDQTYDRAYDVYRAASDHLMEIQWHEANHFGRVKDEHRFGSEEWQCWNGEFIDTDC